MSEIVGAPGNGSVGLCVVCGETFLKLMFLSFTEGVNPPMATAEIQGLGTCALHEECAEKLEACKSDWTRLPEGPLREGYEAAMGKAGED